MSARLSKRKFLAISAAALGLGVVPIGASTRRAGAHVVEWRGVSLGAVATIRIHHGDKNAAERMMRHVVAEAQRIENSLSLYRADSALTELNARGFLAAPPEELCNVLAQCDRIWRITGGVFDPTVQSLWRCYAEHFSMANAAREGPGEARIEQALELIGWPGVAFNRDRVVFARRGMALTLNGIAQGYITDRVTELLRDAGADSCLVDMGEIRTHGSRDGEAWSIGVRGLEDEVSATFRPDAKDMAVASSGAAGYRFDPQGRCNHLFDPTTGRCADPERTITVVAAGASEADALSTALSLMDEGAIASSMARVSGVRAYATTIEGTYEIGSEARRIG